MADHKTILITGGASGLGLALAREAGAHGYRVAIADIHEQRGEEARQGLAEQGIDSMFTLCDVRRDKDLRNAVQRVVRRWGRLDVMVNNAGVAGAGLFEAIGEDDWQWLLDINLMGVVRGSRAAITEMKRVGQGHLVNIASMAGLTPPPGMASYNVAKAGVVSLSETLRSELAPLNIHVTLVCPSFFRTNLGESLRTPDPVTRARFERMLSNNDMTAEQIATVILKAVEKRQFLVIPHNAARKSWRQKRWFPEKFFEGMMALAGKLRR
ncbi:MAG: short chain dehydrogenase [Gammaproteobacteria bacterium HGW-Gammaproteobacteria-14]|nr:MAG: short chain dehydrogenase [Gammaproteobacteria bacterium HGW-Gammaproteobacteria-14]